MRLFHQELVILDAIDDRDRAYGLDTPAWMVARQLQLPVSSAKQLLRDLERKGAVMCRWVGQAPWYRPTEAGREGLVVARQTGQFSSALTETAARAANA